MQAGRSAAQGGDRLHQSAEGDDRRQQDVDGEHQVPRVVAGRIALDQGLVVPAGEVADQGASAEMGQDHPDEGGLADRGDAEPDQAGSAQPAARSDADRRACDFRCRHVQFTLGSSEVIRAVSGLAVVISPIWKSAVDFHSVRAGRRGHEC
ncbi:hypothetical protein D3C81_1519470 [compost metagenome]